LAQVDDACGPANSHHRSKTAIDLKEFVVSRHRLLAILLGSAFILAACGGGSPSAAPGQSTGSNPTSGPTAAGGEPTDAPAATTSGGGGSNDACALVSVEDVAAVTSLTELTVSPVAASDTDAVSACAWVSMGAAPAAIISILDPANTNTDPAGYLTLPGSVEVPVPGATAVYVPAAGYVTFVIKGSKVATVQVTAPKNEDFQAAEAELAAKVAAKL
jgi:hypothetical protein